MRFLLMSKGGDGLGVAQRLAFEGNDVDLWIQEERYGRAGQGIVNRVGEWQSHVRSADVVLCDCVGLGRFEETIRESNKPYMGFNAVLDRVERDRRAGMEMFKRAGLTLPDTVAFSGREELANIPAELGWGDGWVVKTDTGDVSATKVVRDEGQWEHCVGKFPDGAEGIAQRVVDGIEVSTEGWFNGKDWVRPFNHTFEEKRFMSGGVGCNTGCQGNVVLGCGSGNRLTKATVEPMAGLLERVGYRGPFDVNAIVTPEGAYALEATSRLGFDAIEALLEGLEAPAGELFSEVAQGSLRVMPLTEEAMIAVRLSVPPYPFRNPDRTSAGEPVCGITEQRLRHLFLCDVFREDGGYRTAGADGIVAKATAIGGINREKVSLEGRQHNHDYTYEARRRVYRLIRNISVDGLQYRDDVGERANKDVRLLREWGWLDESF